MGKCCLKIESLENQFFYPDPRGSKLILAAPSSPTKPDPLLRSPWGRGNRRTGEKSEFGSVLRSPWGWGKRRKSMGHFINCRISII